MCVNKFLNVAGPSVEIGVIGHMMSLKTTCSGWEGFYVLRLCNL